MVITAILTVFVVWSLLAGSITTPWPLVFGIILGICLFFFGRHKHDSEVLIMDVIARKSRFFNVNPDLKVWSCILLLILCVLSSSPYPGLCLFLLMSVFVILGGVRLSDYLSLLSLPAVFLLLSAVAILWVYTAKDLSGAVVKISFLDGYLVITETAQLTAKLVISRALGAVSCLYFLSLSTPLPEIIAVLRRVKVPSAITDLAILIYRYIFIMLSAYHSMKNSAANRLGYSSLPKSLRTTGFVYGNLLSRSFRRANACFDAMESRCYHNSICFLEHKKALRGVDLLIACLLLTGMAVAVFIT